MLSRLPLRRQVVLATSLLLVPLIGTIVWAGNRSWAEREREVAQQSAALATTVAAAIDQYVGELHGVASTLAQHDAVRALDSGRTAELFSAVLADQPLLADIALWAPDGHVIATGRRRDGGPTAAAVAAVGAAVAAAPRPDAAFDSAPPGVPFVVLRFPVRQPSTSVTSTLGLWVELSQVQDVLRTIPLPSGSVFTVVDQNGRILLRSLDAGRYVGTTAAPLAAEQARTSDVDGVVRLSSSAAMRSAPWRVVVGIPASEALARVSANWGRNLSVVGIGLVITLAVSLWVAMGVSSRLEALRTAAGRIATGDLEAPAQAPMPNLELHQLQDSFTTMAARLRDARDEHRRQVEQERAMNEALQSLQQQVVRQERLGAVGLLVSGLAHELNNPLQAILGTAELLERQPGLTPDAQAEVLFLQTQAIRARQIIRSLARFSEPSTGSTEVVDVHAVVDDVVGLRRSELARANICIAVDGEPLARVRANATDLAMVILNLVVNAEQSLRASGTSAPAIRIRLTADTARVRCEIEDNGCGVAPEDEAKLFQPFYTTRSPGEGVGLGLSASYGIMQALGGVLGYHRNDAGGATFFFEMAAAPTDSDATDRPALLQPTHHPLV